MELDLVYFNETDLLWYPSWDGVGLKNWLEEYSVRQALQEPMLEVRYGENGSLVSAEVCDNFRPILSQGGRNCWCGHSLERHFSSKIP